MVYGKMKEALRAELAAVRDAGLFKEERIITTPQGVEIEVAGRGRVLNFCANNYLGLSAHPRLVEAARETLERWGYGLSSVRFICGTQEIHRELERKIAAFLGLEDAILFAACFDANGGTFEAVFGEGDAIVTDALNHASVIDGIRLSKARRYIYKHADMADLEARLREARDARYRVVATDGVFSMHGDYAPLDEICGLAERYDALVMVDDSHATGFVGPAGRGTHEYCGVMGRVDLITTTFGKALGGASGGCIAGPAELVEWYRQRSRPYLFSNTLAPAVVGATIAALDLLLESTELRDKLDDNQKYFREKMTAAGFDIRPGDHPIVPIMLYNARMAQDCARELLDEGIYVIGFSYPVVPKGEARIRVQISAAHERRHLDEAVAAFTRVGERCGVLGRTREEIIAAHGD